ncbi:hydroxyacid dehydrogenase [Pollutimonas bauzanensis]|uniref:hydroxyacid dehydrogenase n=1 Tax=Pollutimonas bauzanensis TaxID=658167 RepID=UPI00333E29D5
MTKKIIISEFMDEAAVQWLAQRFDVVYEPDLCERLEALSALLVDADALIVRNRTQVNAQLLACQTRLQAVGRLGVGLENIDLAFCRQQAIEVIPALGANAAAVAEYVICCAMQLLRGAYAASSEVAAGLWPRERLINGREIGGKLLGVVGLGSVGRITANLAQAIGMRVVAYDPSLDAEHSIWQTVGCCAELDQLFREADVVSLHVPLSDSTRNLVDARRIGLMPEGAILINVARGGVVDEAALATAVLRGKLAGAAIDVHVQEPLPPGSALADVPNVILTPHIAGVTAESNARVSHFIAQHVAEKLNRSATPQ